ncbi:hypothetical protein J6590_044446 [Homalodisca vitripennis]|nr:hypothetical protein J6590_044446 [Homalodisca vitripennis]
MLKIDEVLLWLECEAKSPQNLRSSSIASAAGHVTYHCCRQCDTSTYFCNAKRIRAKTLSVIENFGK